MDIRTLRQLAGYSQRESARLAGCAVRTWRRWEYRDDPPAVVVRWLKYECGVMPGWPPGFRLARDGIVTPAGQTIAPGTIEAMPWLLSLFDGDDRNAAYAALTDAS